MGGIKKDKERADLIAYMKEQHWEGGGPRRSIFAHGHYPRAGIGRFGVEVQLRSNPMEDRTRTVFARWKTVNPSQGYSLAQRRPAAAVLRHVQRCRLVHG